MIQKSDRVARGYGKTHKRLRAYWQKRIDAGDLILCARAGCGKPIVRGQLWDLGHDDADRSRYSGPEHLRCNRATAGRLTRSRRTSRPW